MSTEDVEFINLWIFCFFQTPNYENFIGNSNDRNNNKLLNQLNLKYCTTSFTYTYF